ncbi:hypothetical protein [Nocardioides humi]|uniref:hypothetical protein n=1 Tax=Nocardioides humi TaxID=449461 RepID=UPI001FE5A9E7|nr:hypothetical protein [Nocardioides humi]
MDVVVGGAGEADLPGLGQVLDDPDQPVADPAELRGVLVGELAEGLGLAVVQGQAEAAAGVVAGEDPDLVLPDHLAGAKDVLSMSGCADSVMATLCHPGPACRRPPPVGRPDP